MSFYHAPQWRALPCLLSNFLWHTARLPLGILFVELKASSTASACTLALQPRHTGPKGYCWSERQPCPQAYQLHLPQLRGLCKLKRCLESLPPQMTIHHIKKQLQQTSLTEPISGAPLTTPLGPFLICLLFLLKNWGRDMKSIKYQPSASYSKTCFYNSVSFSSSKHSFHTFTSRSEMHVFSFLIASFIWSFKYFCSFSPTSPKLLWQLPEMNSFTIYLHLLQFISNRCTSALAFPSLVK